jgi:hypothetical protein
MKTATLLALLFSLSGCASTIEFLDRQVQKSNNYGYGLSNSDGTFRQSARNHIPKRADCGPQNSEADKVMCESMKNPRNRDAEIYAVDPVSGRAFKTGEIDFDLPPGYLP